MASSFGMSHLIEMVCFETGPHFLASHPIAQCLVDLWVSQTRYPEWAFQQWGSVPSSLPPLLCTICDTAFCCLIALDITGIPRQSVNFPGWCFCCTMRKLPKLFLQAHSNVVIWSEGIHQCCLDFYCQMHLQNHHLNATCPLSRSWWVECPCLRQTSWIQIHWSCPYVHSVLWWCWHVWTVAQTALVLTQMSQISLTLAMLYLHLCMICSACSPGQFWILHLQVSVISASCSAWE